MSRYVLVCDRTYYPFIAGYVEAPDADAALSYLKDEQLVDPWHAFPLEGSAYMMASGWYKDPRLDPVDAYYLKDGIEARPVPSEREQVTG